MEAAALTVDCVFFFSFFFLWVFKPLPHQCAAFHFLLAHTVTGSAAQLSFHPAGSADVAPSPQKQSNHTQQPAGPPLQTFKIKACTNFIGGAGQREQVSPLLHFFLIFLLLLAALFGYHLPSSNATSSTPLFSYLSVLLHYMHKPPLWSSCLLSIFSILFPVCPVYAHVHTISALSHKLCPQTALPELSLWCTRFNPVHPGHSHWWNYLFFLKLSTLRQTAWLSLWVSCRLTRLCILPPILHTRRKVHVPSYTEIWNTKKTKRPQRNRSNNTVWKTSTN